MGKFIKILFVGFLISFLIAAIGIFVFIKMFDFNSLKPYIISASHNALGRSLDFKDIGASISFTNGIQLSLTNLQLGEDPEFGSEDFLVSEQVNLGVSIKDFILKREIRVLNIELQSPEINIIRLADGRINVQTLAAAQKTESSPEPSAAPQSQVPIAAIPAIMINKVDISGARLRYIDKLIQPELSLELDQIRFSASDISLTQSFPFQISAAFLSDAPNIKVEGEGRADIESLSFTLKDTQINCDLSGILLPELLNSLPQLKELPLPEDLQGKIRVSIHKLVAGAAGLTELKTQINLSEAAISLPVLKTPLDNIAARCDIDESSVSLYNASFSIGKGQVKISGNIQDYLHNPNFTFTAKAEDLDVSELIDQSTYSIKAEALIFVDAEIKGNSFDPKALVSNLTGSSKIEVKDGKLKDINILKMVLDKLAFVPNLAQTLEANLPERFKEKLQSKDTIVTALNINTVIKNGSILIQPIDMEADGFIFRGDGSVGLDQSYGLEGSFIIPEDLASKIVETVPEMDVLLDSTKEIKFPLAITGQGASVSFRPDVQSIATTVIRNKAEDELGKVLDKLFNKDEQESGTPDGSVQEQIPEESSDSGGDSNAEPVEEEQDSKEQLIKSVTDLIFGQ